MPSSRTSHRFVECFCTICGAAFAPRTGRQYTCGAAECTRERRRRAAAAWYAVVENRAAHRRRMRLRP